MFADIPFFPVMLEIIYLKYKHLSISFFSYITHIPLNITYTNTLIHMYKWNFVHHIIYIMVVFLCYSNINIIVDICLQHNQESLLLLLLFVLLWNVVSSFHLLFTHTIVIITFAFGSLSVLSAISFLSVFLSFYFFHILIMWFYCDYILLIIFFIFFEYLKIFYMKYLLTL